MGGPETRGRRAIKGVIFDYGNVLCDLDRLAVGRAFSAHCPLQPDRIATLIWSEALVKESETGTIDAHVHFERIREAIGGDPSWSFEEFEHEYMACCVPNPDGKAALLGAAKAGLRTFVLSNTSFLHSRSIFLDEELATVPELYALSYKVGFMKPDPRIWLWLLERAGLRAEDCVYIDDIEAYCAQAAALGMATIHYDLRKDILLQKIQERL